MGGIIDNEGDGVAALVEAERRLGSRATLAIEDVWVTGDGPVDVTVAR